MRCGSINFPAEIIKALKNNKLVIFAGAGVSMGSPSLLPNFEELVNYLASGTSLVRNENESLDRFLGRLDHQGTELYKRTAQLLSRDGIEPTLLHKDLLRLFNGPDTVRLVTTNFDPLFEQAAEQLWGALPEVYRAPALPRGNNYFL